jgi:hypothetical protein
MATTTGTRAASTFPAATGGPARLLVAYGSHDFGANPSVADVIQLCKVPAGAIILDGLLRLEDIDSNATETLDIDIGTSADSDAFLNGGVRTGDVVTDYLPEGGVRLPFHGTLKDGPVICSTTQETIIQATIVAAAATFAAGTMTVLVYYVCP